MRVNRGHRAKLGKQTLQILEVGQYQTDTGRIVKLRDLIERAIRNTCSYPPDQPLPSLSFDEKDTSITVENETTLSAAYRQANKGYRLVALNFASAKNPGGGFLSGARAQEESLARASALYACIVGNAMYEFHRRRRDSMYTNYAIYSPDVPVFRTDNGRLLERPYLCSFITAPAVNARVVLQRDPSRRSEIRKAMQARIRKVLTIAAIHAHDTVVLGAWGCGVFGNDPREIAELFHQALMEDFRGAFSRAHFAVLDQSGEQRTAVAFRAAFGLESSR